MKTDIESSIIGEEKNIINGLRFSNDKMSFVNHTYIIYEIDIDYDEQYLVKNIMSLFN